MSILNVNQIQPVGSGQTVTISATNVDAGSATVTAGTFSGGVTVTSGNLTGITSVSTSNLTVNGNAYPATGPLSNRNLIINGDMRVAQRSTSVSVSDGSNEGYQSLDRFTFYFTSSAAGEATISQSTTVPSGEGFSNSYKVDVTTANTLSGTQSISIRHKVEAQDLANSGWNYTSTSSYITISFWARSTKTGTYCLRLKLEDTSTDEYYIAEYTLSAGIWKRVEITVPGHSNAVINNDNGTGLEFEWILGSNDTSGTAGSWFDSSARATTNQVNVFDSTDGEFYLTGVQLEVGTVATPFEHRSYGDELARCQRYYYPITLPKDTATVYSAVVYSTTTILMVPLPVTLSMRTTPTAATTIGTSQISFYKYDGTGNVTQTITTFNAGVRSSSNVYWLELQFTGASGWGTANHSGSFYWSAGTSSTISLSAEL